MPTPLRWGVRDFCSFLHRSLALGNTNHGGSEANTKRCWPRDLGWVFWVWVLLVLVQVWGTPVNRFHFQALPPWLVLAARFRSRRQRVPLGAAPSFPPLQKHRTETQGQTERIENSELPRYLNKSLCVWTGWTESQRSEKGLNFSVNN